MMERDKADLPCNTTPHRRQGYSIRFMDACDFDEMIALGAVMHSESPVYREIPYDTQVLRSTALMWWTQKQVYGVVLEFGTEIVGMMVGLVTPFFFSKAVQVQDLLLYVHPEHRGSARNLLRMMRTYEGEARERGATHSVLGNSAGITPRLTGFYVRQGYKLLSPTMIKEL